MYFRTGGKDEREYYQYNYNTVLTYLSAKCKNKQVVDFFEKHSFCKIAICGIGDLGKCFVNDLINSNIHIEYIIDSSAESYPNGYKGIPVVNIDNIKNNVDVIVITEVFELNKMIDILLDQNIEIEKIININDVVYSL